MAGEGEAVLLDLAHRDDNALTQLWPPIRIGRRFEPGLQIGVDRRRIGRNKSFDGQPHRAIDIEGVEHDARQAFQLPLVQGDTGLPCPLLVLEIDRRVGRPDDVGLTPKHVPQRLTDRHGAGRVRPVGSH